MSFRNLMDVPQSLWIFKSFMGIPERYRGSQVLSRGIKGFQEVSDALIVFHRGTRELGRVSRGASGDLKGFQEIS